MFTHTPCCPALPLSLPPAPLPPPAPIHTSPSQGVAGAQLGTATSKTARSGHFSHSPLPQANTAVAAFPLAELDRQRGPGAGRASYRPPRCAGAVLPRLTSNLLAAAPRAIWGGGPSWRLSLVQAVPSHSFLLPELVGWPGGRVEPGARLTARSSQTVSLGCRVRPP